ncbi:hypothetical protein QN372_13610 [Undibacterium sp. RTI2.1]|uniref:hypothetical protein n=1 Tax=unclassified Undibacterium TaxID=2630295 RepID=UPI002AB35383|nr:MULTISPECIES: hypothetical protein [unclassified Undibacterium]MDY7537933.1 hypothetical protein [Undibacterium sp. 5I1]MEB0031791.1 hypothetical protein [Undibacterium sp. RTI2.1]MEB0117285.1 hypothetical protein [Undibacterium sp. RTI2.2]MEB0232609.1 hypothetical protein [Undibacterium sp. 10I3]MEB0257579.1 hypothetical protein [Undibacterium sp. 5I1]
MKKTGMAKSDAKKLMGKMDAQGAAFGKTDAVVIDKREQRKLDQALGLVPFAVKLNSDLVAQLHALAKERDVGLNELVASMLSKDMEA